MTTPLMSAVDAAGRIREAAFATLLRDRKPVTHAELAEATGLSEKVVGLSVGTLADAGWLDLDDGGRVVGAAGLSLVNGPHRLLIDGEEFRTWCAYDALGISAALASDGELITACGRCGRDLRLSMAAGRPERSRPERLWLAEGGADLRGSFCSPTVLLCGAAHGRAWAEEHGGRGQLLDLESASRRGGSDWAGCAAAARRLA